MVGGCIPLLVAGIALEGTRSTSEWTPLAFATLAYLTILGSVIAFLMYYWLIRHTQVSWRADDPAGDAAGRGAVRGVLRGETMGWHTASAASQSSEVSR